MTLAFCSLRNLLFSSFYVPILLFHTSFIVHYLSFTSMDWCAEEIMKLDTRAIFSSMYIRGKVRSSFLFFNTYFFYQCILLTFIFHNEQNGYVDRAFAVEFQSELSKDILSPQILDGWSTLSSIYGFKGDHSILFSYAGQSFFKITVFMGEICEIGVNSYLKEVQRREPLTKGPFEHFYMDLSDFRIKRNYVVSLRIFYFKSLFYIFFFQYCLMLLKDLRDGLAQYLRQTRFKYVTLHGPVHDVKCKVIRATFPCTNIKLGRGWKKFCLLHSFCEDDKIIFECHMMMALSDIRVLQVKICHYKRQAKVYYQI